jgi:uroporphyrinogen decarboxylase
MTPRENLLSLYRRTGYAFAPVEFGLCPDMQAKMRAAVGEGVSLADYFDYPEGFARAGVPGPKALPRETPDWKAYFPEGLNPETFFNEYGVAHEGGRTGTHHLWRMHHPLAGATSLEELQAYPWPAWDFDDVSAMRAAVDDAHANGLPAMASMACSIWETAWYIRDMTQLMMDMAMEDEKAFFLLDLITEHAVQRAAAYARAGADVICMGDDIGMQQTIMMSLEMYQEWLKPRLGRVIAAAKAIKPDVLVHYHSCGFIEPYIPELIAIGVDILNPVQPECMDFAALHAQYGDVLSFNGTLGTQSTMPFGTPDEVRHTVHRNLEIAGAHGGLVVCPTHLLEPEVPWENVEAYVLACKEFSKVGG